MTDYAISQLTAGTPAASDLLAFVDIDDTTTAPAGTGGSDKNVTVATLASVIASILGGTAIFAYKSADQSVTNSTALVNDSALSISVAANTAYFFLSYIDYEGGAAGASDLKAQWIAPAGATLRYQAIGSTTGGTLASLGTRNQGQSSAWETSGAGVLWGLTMFGTLLVSSTSGTMQFQWAQNTANATSTIVHAQSALIAFPI